MNDNKKFWERHAKMYGSAMKSSDGLYTEIAEHISKRIDSSMKVIELACGTGQITFKLADKVKKWDATDFSEAMIRESQKLPKPDNLSFSVADATSLPYEDESYDAAVIANALHIMPDPEKALMEIRRVIKPGGALIAPTFIWGSSFAFRLRMFIMGIGGFKMYHRWSEDEFVKFVEKCGFKIIEHHMMGGGMIPLCYLEAVKQ